MKFSLLLCAVLLCGAFPLQCLEAREPVSPLMQQIQSSPGRVVLADGTEAPKTVVLTRKWQGDSCRLWLVNKGKQSVNVREIVLFDGPHDLPPDTPLYGDGFTMLAQIAGTLQNPRDVGSYPDRKHYKIPEPDGLRTAYGVLTLSPAAAGARRILLGFTSCRRFVGRFGFDGARLRISLDAENLELKPGQTWQLEEFLASEGGDREALFDNLATGIEKNHPRLRHEPVPTGWCSWYCFGPGVTAKNIEDNLDWMDKNLPALRYVQIDDGYQPWMGDWLDTGKAFGGGVQNVLKEIKQRGFEPAIWVAPFVASPQSRLFQEHPDWFVKDDEGKPLPSNKVGFGGWRLGPWYALDGTHPEAQKWLENLFRTMRRDWGVTYFKLDANYWGAMHGGHRFDQNATRVEAYRRGMEAIIRGAGDAFILGCNHPLWPSLGVIHGSRSSGDISRSWKTFTKTGEENLYRGWQNGRLWWNDPDCLVLRDGKSADIVAPDGKPVTTGSVPENEYVFHATLIYATGGMLLSGDDLTKITPHRLEFLRKSLPPTGRNFRFADESFSVGRLTLKDREMVALFNWSDEPVAREFMLKQNSKLTDYWSGEALGTASGKFAIGNMPPHSARLLEVRSVK